MSIDKEIIRAAVKQAVKRQVQESQVDEFESAGVEAVQLSESEFNELYESIENKKIKTAFKALYEAEDEEEKAERAAEVVEETGFKILEGALGKKWVFVSDGRRAEGIMYVNNEASDRVSFTSIKEANEFISEKLQVGFEEVKREKKAWRAIKSIVRTAGKIAFGMSIFNIFIASVATLFTLFVGLPAMSAFFAQAIVANILWGGVSWFAFKGIKKQIPKDFKNKTVVRA